MAAGNIVGVSVGCVVGVSAGVTVAVGSRVPVGTVTAVITVASAVPGGACVMTTVAATVVLVIVLVITVADANVGAVDTNVGISVAAAGGVSVGIAVAVSVGSTVAVAVGGGCVGGTVTTGSTLPVVVMLVVAVIGITAAMATALRITGIAAQ